MISNVILDSQGAEAELLKKVFHDEAANLSDEQWQIDLFKSPEAFLSYLASGPLIDMACVDVCQDEGAALLEAFRQRYGDVWLMVIADAAVSPMTYLKPSIMPGSLLLRPADAGRIRQVVREFIEAFLLRFGSSRRRRAFLWTAVRGASVFRTARSFILKRGKRKSLCGSAAVNMGFMIRWSISSRCFHSSLYAATGALL